MTKKDLLWKLAYLVIAGSVFMIYCAAKAWVTSNRRLRADVSVISGFLNFSHPRIPGFRFSMLANSVVAGWWVVALVASVGVSCVVCFF